MKRRGHIFEVNGVNSEIIIVRHREMQLRKITLKIIKMARVIGGLFEVGDQ